MKRPNNIPMYKGVPLYMSVPKKFIVPLNDAEAYAIRDMCIRQNQDVLGVEIGWGATWEKVLEMHPALTLYTGVLVGIELQGQRPKNGISIDHHTDETGGRYNTYSSLDQVAAMLGVKLDFEEYLISLNDKGYIPAMRYEMNCMGMEENTIHEWVSYIRYLDRKAQGVTKEQEDQCRESIQAKKRVGNYAVYTCKHSRTSPICDAEYGVERYICIQTVQEDKLQEVNIYAPEEEVSNLRTEVDILIYGKDEESESYFSGAGYIGSTSEAVMTYLLDRVTPRGRKEESNE